MGENAIAAYISKIGVDNIDPGFLSYITSLQLISKVSPSTASSIVNELDSQRSYLKLIASENYTSLAVQAAMGNLLTDKYAEGFPYHRFYAGCDNVDVIEADAVEKAKQLFGADHAYVQPHSGADANMVAYWAVLSHKVQNPAMEKFNETNPNKLSREDWNSIRELLGRQKLLGLDYYSGGHLTHGYRFNVSAQMFDAYTYTVNRETGILDYDEIEKQALEIKPLILLAGYSAYPRLINFKRMKEIADKAGSVLMVDMAHFAGLVAGKVMTGDFDPIAHADIVTTTTHKTLRGPRGGMILCKQEFAEAVDKGCPMILGGPLPHVMAAKAVAYTEALDPEFKGYAEKIVSNAKILANACIEEGIKVATNGTDNHLMLLDVTPFGLNGRQAENAVRECGITLNRNALPFDINGPWYTSGLRVGTPAVTSLGMGLEEMKEIAGIIKLILSHTNPKILTKGANAGKPSKAKYTIDPQVKAEAKSRVADLLGRFPVYPEIDLEFLQEYFV
ncbi:MAG: glycine hydroxymethyltransferase [Spirochaetales bacterium]|nr:glycine hydroxymethyltransferase [Spirochaetales bacterium]